MVQPRRGLGIVFLREESLEEEPGPHTSSKLDGDFAAMALLSSVTSAATSRVAVAPCTAVSRRHGDFGFCAPGIGRIAKNPAGKCRAQAVRAAETATPVAERPLWLPGSTPPAYLDGT